MYGYIYETKNNINGKTYIGKKNGEFDKNYYGSGVILQQALKKYGRANFSISILGYFDTDDDLNQAEKMFIIDRNPEYNIAAGGTGGNTLKMANDDHRRNVIEKRRIGQQKAWDSVTEDERKARGLKISEAKRGKPSGHLGKKRSQETRDAIQEGLRRANLWKNPNWLSGHAAAAANRRGKPFPAKYKQVTVNGVTYESVGHAMTALGIKNRTTFYRKIKNGTIAIVYDKKEL